MSMFLAVPNARVRVRRHKETKMETQILTDPTISPDDTVLKKALGKTYKIFLGFSEKAEELALVLEWNYYKDGKSWLCKVLNKKKNMCWLSVWNTGFKLTFYFTAETMEGVYKLNINDTIKKAAQKMKPVGKLHPLIILIENNEALSEGIKIIEYKMKLK